MITSPGAYQRELSNMQQRILQNEVARVANANYWYNVDSSGYNPTENAIQGAAQTVGNLIGQNVSPVAGNLINALGSRADLVSSAADKIGDLVGGERNFLGRALKGLREDYVKSEEEKDTNALKDYYKSLVGAYLTDNPRANPNQVKKMFARNLKKGRNPYYGFKGITRPEMVHMSEAVNHDFIGMYLL
jgi:hypothetical protein